MDNNNFQATNFKNQNSQTETRPDIEMPMQADQPKQKNKLMVPFIILLILTVGGLTFGIFEFMQNSSLKTEIADLKAKIEKPETPPEEPVEKMYSGVLEFEVTDNPDDGSIGTTYTVKLNYETGELNVEGCTNSVCLEYGGSITLTDKEMKKIWWITDVDYDKEELAKSLATLTFDQNPLAEAQADIIGTRPIECDDDTSKCRGEATNHRELANDELDEMLFEAYGWLNCMPNMYVDSETNCLGVEGANCSADAKTTDCLGGEGTDCESETTEVIESIFNCRVAESIDYPYIAY